MTAATEKQANSKENKSKGTLRLKYFRSVICTPIKHKRIVKGLGFTRLQQVVEREDTPSIRGMVNKVPHLVKILDAPESTASKPGPAKAKKES